MITRRGRGATAPTIIQESDTESDSIPFSSSSTETIVSTERASSSSLTEIENTHSQLRNNNSEKLGLKLNQKYDKLARFNSHLEFLSTCTKEKLIPRGFRIEIDPSIGNHDEAFMNKWYNKVNNLSIELMKDTAAFCQETITSTEADIKNLEDAIKQNTDKEEYNNITSTIKTFHDQTISRLKKTKTTKYRKLKWNITQPNTSTTRKTKQETQQHNSYPQQHAAQPKPRSFNNKQTSQQRTDQPATPQPTFAEILKRKNDRRSRAKQNEQQNYATTQPRITESDRRATAANRNNAPKNDQVLHPQNEGGGLYLLISQTADAINCLNENFGRLLNTRMTHSEEW